MRLPYLEAAVVRDVLLLLFVSRLAFGAGAASADDDAPEPETPAPLWIQPSGDWYVEFLHLALVPDNCACPFHPVSVLIALAGMVSMGRGQISHSTSVHPPRSSI